MKEAFSRTELLLGSEALARLEKVQQAASKRKNSANLSAWHIDLEVRYGDVLVRVETVGPEPEWVYAQLQALQIP